MVRSKRSGFTLTEVKVALVILSVIALFMIPKMKSIKEDRQASAAIRSSFSAVGDAFLKRAKDETLTSPNIGTAGGTEHYILAQYMFKYLNHTSAKNPATYTAATLCGTADDYFTLGFGAVVRKICDDDPSNTLQVTVRIPMKSLSPPYREFQIYIPNEGTGRYNRYTTKYGYTGSSADCIDEVDPVLKIPFNENPNSGNTPDTPPPGHCFHCCP